MLLPGLKRWILINLMGIFVVVFGVLLLLGYHPVTVLGQFIREILEHAADILPHRISGIMAIVIGGLVIGLAIAKMTLNVLGAYLPDDRESIPDVLYRRRHLDRGPRIVVIGGGTGLANLLRGLKNFTSNLTAIVTVGDDGGSSGRLREELGVLPPGDIRNCIAALADEEEIVTELFSYRFTSGQGLEGHSFGNLFLSALCAITNGDMLEAVKVTSRVLNSRGQVLPSTLSNITLVAEMADGHKVVGESTITAENDKIVRMRCQPADPKITPEVRSAIKSAELIIFGPGSLYTSIIPNMLIPGLVEAVVKSKARKIYVCNVMTQPGETTGYSVGDHLEALIKHSGLTQNFGRLIQSVFVNDHIPDGINGSQPVRLDPENIKRLGIKYVQRPLISETTRTHHDPSRLAKFIVLWLYRKRKQDQKKKGLFRFGLEESSKAASL